MTGSYRGSFCVAVDLVFLCVLGVNIAVLKCAELSEAAEAIVRIARLQVLVNG